MVKKLESIIRGAFSSFSVESVDFLKCGQDNTLSIVEDQDMDGDAVLEVAGQ